jgi:hypothetical protein
MKGTIYLDITPYSTLKVNSACYLLHADFLPDFFFDLEDGGDVFLWNVGWLPTDYAALYPSKQTFSFKYVS